MLVSRFNPPLRCVKTLNAKTLYAQRDSWPNLPYSSQANEVKNEKRLLKYHFRCHYYFRILMTSSVYAIPASSRFLTLKNLSVWRWNHLGASFVGIPINLSGL